MPKITTKYYRRAKANTDSLINSIESDQAFDQCLNNDLIRNDNDMNINEQLNYIDLDDNNLNNIEFDSNNNLIIIF